MKTWRKPPRYLQGVGPPPRIAALSAMLDLVQRFRPSQRSTICSDYDQCGDNRITKTPLARFLPALTSRKVSLTSNLGHIRTIRFPGEGTPAYGMFSQG